MSERKLKMRTKTDLVADLLHKPESKKRTELIDKAKEGYYHDFETPIATPKVQLVQDLEAAGFIDLAIKVKDGEYD